jgi:quinol monooxygenase YgiN
MYEWRKGMSENSIRIVARVVARPDSVDRVRSILSDLVEPTLNESGCISYELLQNRTDQTDFTFVEEWESDAAIDAHLTTRHIRDVLTKLPGLVSGEPDIRRYSVVKKKN